MKKLKNTIGDLDAFSLNPNFELNVDDQIDLNVSASFREGIPVISDQK